jgi:hypothetical protein
LSRKIRLNSEALLAQLPAGEENHLWPSIDEESEGYEDSIIVLRREAIRLNQRLEVVKQFVRESCPRVYPE